MDPFTLALATFGVQKLRGKSTRTALKDAALVGGTTFGIGQLGGMSRFAGTPFASATQGFRGSAFSSMPGMGDSNFLKKILGEKKMTAEQIKAAGLEGEAAKAAAKGSGILGADTGTKLIAASTIAPFLMGDEEPVKPLFTEEDYKQNYN